MSKIYKDPKCEHCGQVNDGYISFGHPKEDFDFPWECYFCHKENIIHVLAWGKEEGIQ